MRAAILILSFFIQTVSFAQSKQMSLKDAVYGRYTYLRPETMRALQWRDDEFFTFVEHENIVSESAKTSNKDSVLSLNEMNDIAGLEFPYIPQHKWVDASKLLIETANKYCIIDSDKRIAKLQIELPEKAENGIFSLAGEFVAFTQEDDLFVALADGTIKQITNDGGNGIVNGQTVHRNEFGISGGIFNSPKGNFVAFYRKDESMVKDYPLVDFSLRMAECKPVKYPMAGMDSHQVTVGIYNFVTGKTTYLKTGEPLDHYLTNVSWSPNEKYIYLAELNREQNHMQLNCYDVTSGDKVKTLFEEESDTYVEPLYPIQFSKVNADELYYLSRKDGWFHVYKYNTDGELVQQLTKGEWEVTNLLGFDAKEKTMFVEATLENPLETHIYMVNLKSGKIQKLSSDSGVHSGMLSTKATYLIDRWSGSAVPGNIDLVSVNKNEKRTIFEAEDPLTDYALGENSLVELKTNDGKHRLYGRLILPPDFEPTKKYPVVVYVYGGPHSQLVTKAWHNQARWWQYYMASQGYIAFTLDNRGTLNRGRDFETAVHRNLGMLETEDQMQGIEYLKTLPYVNADRIGVHGWSYGGFMTLNMKLKHPEVFKVAVAGGPVVDWSMYEVMYGERYMDMPNENPEGYKNSDMSAYVKNLEGKLLLIHGLQDKTVVMQHSMKFIRECVKQNKQVDFFTYPSHEHNVRGKDRIHLMQKVSEYFFENL